MSFLRGHKISGYAELHLRSNHLPSYRSPLHHIRICDGMTPSFPSFHTEEVSWKGSIGDTKFSGIRLLSEY